MSQDWEVTPVLNALDRIIESAYFVPLALGDALALLFRNESLKGLPTAVVADIMNLMDVIGAKEHDDGPSAMDDFFCVLRDAHPFVYRRWQSADQGRVYDPQAAFRFVLTNGGHMISAFLDVGPEDVAPGELAAIVEETTRQVMAGIDERALGDDCLFRRYVRETVLPGLPPWSQPSLYLELWAQYVRGITDWDPLPETRARWPY